MRHFLLKMLARLPFGVLFVLSDFCYYVVYYIVRYRRKVVRENLTHSFPDKSLSDIVRIEQKFYRHFCDQMMETIKLLHITDEEMRAHFKISNPEFAMDLARQKRVSIMLLGHYCNWEWTHSLAMLFSDELPCVVGQIYRPLKNKWFDAFFLRLRSRFGSMSIPKNDTLRAMLRLKASGKAAAVGFISDQTPSPQNIHHWINFLNQDTPVLMGYEKIAVKADFPVFYLDIRKVKRGYYESTFVPIAMQPTTTKEFEITDKYMALMEQTILRAPQYWLWTHKRWKHKRVNPQ